MSLERKVDVTHVNCMGHSQELHEPKKKRRFAGGHSSARSKCVLARPGRDTVWVRTGQDASTWVDAAGRWGQRGRGICSDLNLCRGLAAFSCVDTVQALQHRTTLLCSPPGASSSHGFCSCGVADDAPALKYKASLIRGTGHRCLPSGQRGAGP